MRDPADLSRDVIKSDTAEVSIPELDLHITTGSLGGLITTVEGLATSVQVALCLLILNPGAAPAWRCFLQGSIPCAAE